MITMIKKRDGRSVEFDINKIKNGLIKACEKRPISLSQIEKMAGDIEKDIQNNFQQEIPSAKIGELVMDKLKEKDEVAYVRFASVYREFKDIETFLKELSQLKKENN